MANIIVIGAGGLGTPVTWGLAACWPTNLPQTVIHIFDGDGVEISNLNRQVLFDATSVGRDKAELLTEKIKSLETNCINNSVSIVPHSEYFSLGAHSKLVDEAALIIEASDSLENKFALNDYCAINNIPFCYAGVVGENALIFYANFKHKQSSPCLRCVFGELSLEDYRSQAPTCRQAGIIGAVAGHVGFKQAELALAHFFANSPPAFGLLRFSMSDLYFSELKLTVDFNCPNNCAKKSVKVLDLRDKTCPSTFLYTKLALQQILPGEVLEVVFGNIDSLNNVCESIVEDGYIILNNPNRIAENTWQVCFKRPFILHEKNNRHGIHRSNNT